MSKEVAMNHRPPEIDHRTMKLIVGLMALSLASLTSYFASDPITSISASYYESGWSSNIFVGFLFAIGSFLLAYNGYTSAQLVASKIAAVAALCIALFPCACDTHVPLVPHVHGIAAAIMFGILAFFCWVFFQRARAKKSAQAKTRSGIYALCGLAIVAAILTLAYDNLSGGSISSKIVRLTFYGEKAGLIAFSVSWLTASHYLPFLSAPDERPWASDPQPIASSEPVVAAPRQP
jgi:hypothetical protein